jgi:hypothetical protein
MAEVVRLEGFSAPLKCQRIWICGKPSTLGQQLLSRLSAIEEELIGRGRKVLMIQNSREIPMRWSHKVQWDATFRIRDTQDLRLAMTYVQNAVKPLRVVWIGDEPPMAVLNIMAHNEVTFVVGSIQNPRLSWSAIFWHSSADQSFIEEGLNLRMGTQVVQKANIGNILKELRASQVGLVWSSIGETEKTGSIYWYDAEESSGPPQMERQDILDSLREITDFLSIKL